MATKKSKRTDYVPTTATIDCPHCNAVVAAQVLGHYAFLQDGPDVPIRYLFTRCPSCSGPMVAAQENWGDWNNDHHFDKPTRVLPSRAGLGVGVPMLVSRAFDEATRCFGAQAYTAAAIMCRKSLEALVAEHNVKVANLASGLKKLRDKGLIEARLFEWADALRLAGNDAAHSVDETVSRDDAQDTLYFTAALIEYVFTFRDRFEEFQARRTTKKKAAP